MQDPGRRSTFSGLSQDRFPQNRDRPRSVILRLADIRGQLHRNSSSSNPVPSVGCKVARASSAWPAFHLGKGEIVANLFTAGLSCDCLLENRGGLFKSAEHGQACTVGS